VLTYDAHRVSGIYARRIDMAQGRMALILGERQANLVPLAAATRTVRRARGRGRAAPAEHVVESAARNGAGPGYWMTVGTCRRCDDQRIAGFFRVRDRI